MKWGTTPLIQKGIIFSCSPAMDYTSETCCSIVALCQYLTLPENMTQESGQTHATVTEQTVDVSH